MLVNLNYYCSNGAHHTYLCCDSCWNKHENTYLRKGSVATDIFLEEYKKAKTSNFLEEAKEAEFSKAQIFVLLKYCVL